MSKETNERLKLYTAYLQTTPRAFEKSIGASNGFFRSISKGIGADKYLEISRRYPDLNIDWLLTGEGEMLKHAGNNVLENSGNIKGDIHQQTAGNRDLTLALENERLKATNEAYRERIEELKKEKQQLLDALTKTACE